MNTLLQLLPSFHEPVLLLAVTVAGGLVSALATWIGAPGWGMGRRVLAILAGTLLACALGAALAGPFVVEQETRAVRRVVVLDGSASLRAAERPHVRDMLLELAATAQQGDGLVLYGDEVAIARVASDEILPAELLEQFAAVDAKAGAGTRARRRHGSISASEEALRIARAFASLDEDMEIVWITDGRELPPDLAEAAGARAALRRMSVHLAGGELSDSRPTRLIVPERITAGTPFEVGLAVASSDGARAEYDVELRSLDDPEAETVRVHRGDLSASDGLQRFGPLRLDAGSYMVKARHLGDDALPANDTLHARIDVAPPPRALIVHGSPVAAVDDLALTALRAQGIDATVARSTAGVADLLQSELIVLDNVRPDQLEAKWITALAEHVRERGAGLLFSAGDQPDSHHAWNGTVLADLLPVRFREPAPAPEDPAEAEEGDDPTEPDPDGEPELATASVPRFGVVLCIDRSGSMEARDKLEIAKASAIKAAEAMHPADEIAVVAFDDNAHLVLPWTAASEQSTIRGQLARLQPGGSTNIYKALKMSHDILRSRLDDFAVRHVILMTDGYSMTMGRYTQLLRKMVRDKVTVTTIGIGGDYDRSVLGKIAYESKGRTEFVEDFAKLPLIVTRDVRHFVSTVDRRPLEEADDPDLDAAQPRTLEDAESTTVNDDVPELVPAGVRAVILHRLPFLLTGSGEPFELPVLAGFTPVDLRAGALEVMAAAREPEVVEDSPMPLLVAARAGRGRVLVWCGDMGGAWTSEWFRWADAPQFLAQTLRSLLPDSPPGSYYLLLDTRALGEDRIDLSLAAFDPGGAIDLDVELQLEVATRLGVQRLVTRPGPRPGGVRAEVRLPPGEDAVELRARAIRDGRTLAERWRVLHRTGFGELEDLRVRGNEWQAWATAAGGRVGALPSDRAGGTVRTRQRDLTLWPLLLAAGILVILAVLRRTSL